MTIQARDVMVADVLTVSPDLELDALGETLISKRITGAAVVEEGRLVGVVSRSDIVRAARLGEALVGFVADELVGGEMRGETGATAAELPHEVRESLTGRTVRDAMATSPVTVRADAPVAEVAVALRRRHIHRVFVLDGDALVGVISSLDLVGLIAEGRLREA